jgi:hypothetical protein
MSSKRSLWAYVHHVSHSSLYVFVTTVRFSACVEEWLQSFLTFDVVWSQAFIFCILLALTMYIGRVFGVSIDWDSSVGIVTRYGLNGAGIESWWGLEITGPTKTGCGAHIASCTVSTGSFPGVNRSGPGVDHPTSSNAEVKKQHSYNCNPLWAFVARSRVTVIYLCKSRWSYNVLNAKWGCGSIWKPGTWHDTEPVPTSSSPPSNRFTSDCS